MILSEKQKRIIASVQLQANASVAQIAEETGFRPHVVRYALDFLREKHILAPYACVDLMRLGLDDHCAYFTYLCDSEHDREKLLKFLVAAPQVTVVSEFAGEYQYNAAPHVDGLDAVDRFFSQITKLCQGQFVNKAVATRVKWALFRPKYLSSHETAATSIVFGREPGQGSQIAFDESDYRILWYLAQPDFLPKAQIARALKLPASSVEDRVKRMEESGVIRGYAYKLNTAACGVHSFRLLVYQKHSSEGFADQLFRFAETHPNITSFVHCVGNWDYELGIRTERPEEAPAVVQEVYSRHKEQIGSLKLLSMLQRLKFNLFPFDKNGSVKDLQR